MFLLFLMLFFCQPCFAQDVYISNHLFKGPVSESGAQMKVGLRELATALDLSFEEKDGLWAFEGSEIPEGADKGIVIEGKVLEYSEGEGGPMVNLKEFAEAAGLTYRTNSDLGTIDVIQTAKKGKKGGFVFTGVPTVLNRDTPGETINVDSYILPGYLNFFLWYRTGQKDAGYRSVYSKVDVLAKFPKVNLVKINVGNENSPLAKKAPGMVPRLVVLKGRQPVQQYNGHSILQALKDPEATIDAMWKR